jgi:N-acetylgalactosamine-6-sulfatase
MGSVTRRSLLAAPALALAQTRRPNVVLIVADDLGSNDISASGSPDIRTPHIDSIARGGVRFTQSYANAPECTPTRAALLTGRYQHRIGGLECAIGVNNIGRYDEAAWLQQRGELGLPASEPTFAQILKKHGYDTACVGKWHLGYLEKFWPDKHGFDHWIGILGGNADYFTHEEQNEGSGKPRLFSNGRLIDRKGRHLTDVFADAALAWLGQRRGRPFFLYLPFTAPHTPIQAADELDPKTGTAPHRQGHRPTYVKMVEHMDRRIGDVLARVPENTIVFFISDNGGDANGRNDPFKGKKSSVWEGGIRAPMHIRWPGKIHPGTVSNQVALSMDILPTILAAAGIQSPHELDGVNLLPVVTGEQAAYPRTVCWRYKRAQAVRRAIRDVDWKYVRDGETEALHDLASDPREENNRLAEQPQVAAKLRARLAAWEKEVQAPRLKDFRT